MVRIHCAYQLCQGHSQCNRSLPSWHNTTIDSPPGSFCPSIISYPSTVLKTWDYWSPRRLLQLLAQKENSVVTSLEATSSSYLLLCSVLLKTCEPGERIFSSKWKYTCNKAFVPGVHTWACHKDHEETSPRESVVGMKVIVLGPRDSSHPESAAPWCRQETTWFLFILPTALGNPLGFKHGSRVQWKI